MAIAANKSDMYEFEEVTEEEGVALARQINAIFQSTSAKDQNGSIDKLFQNLGRKFLHPNSDIGNDSGNNSKNRGTQLNSKNGGKEKKGCFFLFNLSKFLTKQLFIIQISEIQNNIRDSKGGLI